MVDDTKVLYEWEVDADMSFMDLLEEVEEEGGDIQFGFKKSPEDDEDLTVEVVEDKLQTTLFTAGDLVKTDNRPFATAIRDQGFEGTCVGFATAAMKEWQERKERATWAFSKSAIRIISPRFIYFECREPYGWDNEEDQGAYIRDALKVLHNTGAIIESGWPYVAQDWDSEPNPMRVADAPRYKVSNYVSLDDPDVMARWLAEAGPFVAGIELFRGFFKPPQGQVPMPKDNDYSYGWHAVCVEDYDPDGFGFGRGSLYCCKNSWADDYGDGGRFYLQPEYLRDYSADSWGSLDILTTRPRGG